MPESLSPQLVMRRPALTGLPPVVVPAGCSIRCYETDADAAAWDRIIGESFELPNAAGMFDRTMRADAAFRPDRVLFICCDGEPVGTASAWHSAKYGDEVGWLHYVGVLKAHTGRGLGYAVSLACLHKLASERRTCAMLLTDDFRLPALKQYLRLGFVPVLVDENQRERWRKVFAGLGRPDLEMEFAEILDGAIVQR